jgi:acyl carrier protein
MGRVAACPNLSVSVSIPEEVSMSDRLTQTFASVLDIPVERLNEESSPANTPEWDSLATVNLTLGVEFEFGIKLSTQETMSMTSIGLARAVLVKKGVTEL